MSFFSKIKNALFKTSAAIGSITDIFTKKGIDASTLEELEETLLLADFGAKTTEKILSELKKVKIPKDQFQEMFKHELVKIIAKILTTSESKLKLKDGRLNILVFCGVNGNGKTTTIGKLASLFSSKGYKVMVAACDTFRSAAVSQLEVWAQRAGCFIVTGKENSDPASVAHLATTSATEQNYDILMIDTAGRLQNKTNLMSELAKIINVIKKLSPDKDIEIILTLDSTTGQNASVQVEKFSEIAGVTGLIFTKLDGTAKGGAIIGIADRFKLPIYYITTGESLDDIAEFEAESFAKALVMP
ncbi:MAG: signal recognition particle-docking protein FtsY [Rickettsiaceae bacterium]|nr:signal recognition particle-docking protein FtsY [Rickettsiaceae bacterium]